MFNFYEWLNSPLGQYTEKVAQGGFNEERHTFPGNPMDPVAGRAPTGGMGSPWSPSGGGPMMDTASNPYNADIFMSQAPSKDNPYGADRPYLFVIDDLIVGALAAGGSLLSGGGLAGAGSALSAGATAAGASAGAIGSGIGSAFGAAAPAATEASIGSFAQQLIGSVIGSQAKKEIEGTLGTKINTPQSNTAGMSDIDISKSGVIPEPVKGTGQITGKSYSFAEYAPEQVSKIPGTEPFFDNKVSSYGDSEPVKGNRHYDLAGDTFSDIPKGMEDIVVGFTKELLGVDKPDKEKDTANWSDLGRLAVRGIKTFIDLGSSMQGGTPVFANAEKSKDSSGLNSFYKEEALRLARQRQALAETTAGATIADKRQTDAEQQRTAILAYYTKKTSNAPAKGFDTPGEEAAFNADIALGKSPKARGMKIGKADYRHGNPDQWIRVKRVSDGAEIEIQKKLFNPMAYIMVKELE